ncbi:MAG TPA: TorF family putative porin, partial [Janthinobacterium sp.]|nr:TorF family putative porin [Janthinobacterium sp.]
YLKYSQSTTNLFAVANSKYSAYIDVGGNFDIGHGVTLNLHVGRQNVRHSDNLSYTDYKVGVSKDFGIVALTLAAVYADTDAYIGPGGEAKNLAKTSLVVAVSKTF